MLAEFPLDRPIVHIGRRPNNEIHIDNLAVSGEHAIIVQMGKDFYVEDVGSTNGTMVNGEVIQKHLLKHADVVELGKHQLRYINDEMLSHLGTEQLVQEAVFEKTVMVRSANPKVEHVFTMHSAESPVAVPATEVIPEPEPQVVPDPIIPAATASVLVAKIQVLNGVSVGRELVLNKAMTTLGKPGVQVAVINKRANGYFITHVEGKIHPLVNNQSIRAQAYALRDHDVIELAGIKMEFHLNAIA